MLIIMAIIITIAIPIAVATTIIIIDYLHLL